MSGELALHGGDPVREDPFPEWPVWDERERAALEDVLSSGTWGVDGTQTEAFCDEFAAELGASHAVTVTSGTTALEIALRAAGVEPGDEVIVPAYTFVATASAVLDCTAVPVFADIERGSLCLDPAAVERRITDRTAAVVPVHLGGRPADVNALRRICDDNGLALIEDCAQAHGTRIDGRALGTVGDAGCFSFQSSKNVTAGEGGLILTDDEEIHERAWSIHNVGRVRGGKWYEHPVRGGNYRMTEFQAALLRVQLTRMDEQLARRERNARGLTDGLDGIRGVEPQTEHPGTTDRGYHLYVLRLDRSELAGVSKGTFIEALRAEGVPVGSGYRPLYEEELFTRIEQTAPAACALAEEVPEYGGVSCPETEAAAEEVCWLSQNLLIGGESETEDVVRAIEKVVDGVDALGS